MTIKTYPLTHSNNTLWFLLTLCMSSQYTYTKYEKFASTQLIHHANDITQSQL